MKPMLETFFEKLTLIGLLEKLRRTPYLFALLDIDGTFSKSMPLKPLKQLHLSCCQH